MRSIVKSFLLIYLVFGLSTSFAQTPKDSLISTLEDFYDTLSVPGLGNDILFNQGFGSSECFEDWDTQAPMIFHSNYWNHFKTAINIADAGAVLPTLESVQSNTEFDIYDPQKNTSSLLVYYNQGKYIKDDELMQYVDSGIPFGLNDFKLLLGVPAHESYPSLDVNFQLDFQHIFLEGNAITSLEISFDDVVGFRSVSLNSVNSYAINYSNEGEKNLMFRLITAAGDTVISYSVFTVYDLSTEMAEAAYVYFEDSIPDSIPTGSRTSVYGLDVLYLKGVDNKLDKPFFLIEGLDIQNKESTISHLNEFRFYISDLRAAGYDVFIVDFPGIVRTFDLKKNAARIQWLIKSVNSGGSLWGTNHGNYEGAIMGISMGGIIGRIALKNLENQNYDHKVGWLLTVDSPHKGANNPLAFQKSAVDLYNELPIYILRGKLSLASIAAHFLCSTNSDDPCDAALEVLTLSDAVTTLKGISAQQLLAQHYLGNIQYNLFQSYLATLGWPQKSRNVALTAGSMKGVTQGISGSENVRPGVLNVPYPIPPYSYTITKFKFGTQNSSSNFTYWKMLKIPISKFFFWGTKVLEGQYTFSGIFWDNAAGSYGYAGIPGLKDAGFAPTLSSIDYHNMNSVDVNNTYKYTTTGKAKADFFANNKVGVDEIYGIDRASNPNLWHPGIYRYGIINDIIINQELMVTDYYLQNRTFDKDRDIECGGKMVVGSDVLPPDKYLYDDNTHLALTTTETKKTQPTGEVQINTGVHVNLEAKTSIVLSKGFKTNNVGRFTAKVNGTDPNKRSDNSGNQGCGRIIISNIQNEIVYSASGEQKVANWNLKGYRTDISISSNEFTIPDYIDKGQYSLTAKVDGCVPSSIVVVKEKTSELNDNDWKEKEIINTIEFTLRPNPANTLVKIDSEVLFTKVKISNVLGNLLFEQEIETGNKEFSIEISDFASGTYFVEIKSKDEYLGSKKLVIQH